MFLHRWQQEWQILANRINYTENWTQIIKIKTHLHKNYNIHTDSEGLQSHWSTTEKSKTIKNKTVLLLLSLTAELLWSPLDTCTSYVTLLSISCNGCTQALTITTQITATCIKNAPKEESQDNILTLWVAKPKVQHYQYYTYPLCMIWRQFHPPYTPTISVHKSHFQVCLQNCKKQLLAS